MPQRGPSTAWRRSRLACAAALCGLAAVAGCDFTPVLDIPLPDHEPRLSIHAVLVADSTVSIAVRQTADPYRRASGSRTSASEVIADASVELSREGGGAEALRFQPRRCENGFWDFDPSPQEVCGRYVSTSTIEPGQTYTVRVRAPGLPDAEATVAVPSRVEVSEVTRPDGPDSPRVSFALRDPAGAGQHYALQLAPQTYINTYQYPLFTEEGEYLGDTTITQVDTYSRRFQTRDPFLTAAARLPASEWLDLVTFSDQGLDGTARTFTIETFTNEYGPGGVSESTSEEALWLVSIDERSYQAYQATYFSFGEDNPFEEPSNLPSNVVGGYGLVGAAVIHERAIPPGPAPGCEPCTETTASSRGARSPAL